MAFRDLFIKAEDANSGQPQTAAPTSTASVGSPRNLSLGTPTPTIESIPESRPTNVESRTSTMTITADEGIVNKVWDKIIAANRPGPDYLELKIMSRLLKTFLFQTSRNLCLLLRY